MTYELVLLAIAIPLLIGVYSRLSEHLEPSEAEQARQAYAAGEISLVELERRLEGALDEEHQRMREELENVEHVGPETSAAIADAFDSRADLETASKEDLTTVHGVGPSTADAIDDYYK